MAVLGKIAGAVGKSATKGAISGGLKKAAVNYGKDILTKTATGGASNWLSSLLGGGSGGLSGGGGSGLSGILGGGTGLAGLGGDLFKGLLSGLSAAAGAKGDLAALKETTKIKGLEDRKTTAYEAELLDFYKNKDKYRDFRALDNYSQFSRVSQFAPNYRPTYTGPTDPGTAPLPKA